MEQAQVTWDAFGNPIHVIDRGWTEAHVRISSNRPASCCNGRIRMWFVFSATQPQSAAAGGSKTQVTAAGTFQVGDPEQVAGGGTFETFLCR